MSGAKGYRVSGATQRSAEEGQTGMGGKESALGASGGLRGPFPYKKKAPKNTQQQQQQQQQQPRAPLLEHHR